MQWFLISLKGLIMLDVSNYLFYVSFFALIGLVLLLMLREATMWYWKINLRNDLLRQILIELKEIKRGMRKSPDDKKEIKTPENPTSLKNVKMSSLSNSNVDSIKHLGRI
jgi:hypothetical protein